MKKALLTAIAASLILSIFIFHFYPSPPHSSSYLHLRLAKQLHISGLSYFDQLMSRPALIKPYHLIIALLGSLSNVQLAHFIIAPILTFLILFMLALFLRSIGLKNITSLAIALTAASPPFLFLVLSSNPAILSIALLLCILVCTASKNWKINIIAIPLACLLAVSGPIEAIAAVSAVVLFALYRPAAREQLSSLLLIIALTSLFAYLPLIGRHGIPRMEAMPFINAFADLGSVVGYGTFTLLLGIIGLGIFWKRKKFITLYLCIIAFFILGFYSFTAACIVNMILAICAARAIRFFYARKWALRAIKSITLVAFFCGLALSSITASQNIALLQPSKPAIDSLLWLKQNSNQNDIVFSHPDNGFLIEFFAQRRVLLDKDIAYIPTYEEKLNATQILFHSRDLRRTVNTILAHQIKYIWIDQEMKTSDPWTEPDQGLLFLLPHKETFKLVYDRNGIQIWKVLV